MSSSHSTPSKSKTAAAKASSRSKASSSRSTRSSPNMFTPQMQDRQARNKDPYSSSDDSSDSPWEGQSRKFDAYAYGNDTYEQVQRRREAAIVLDNPELLMMHAQARFDSIPGTRHYFTKLLCGYQDDKDPYSVSMREQAERHKAKSNKEAQKEGQSSKGL